MAGDVPSSVQGEGSTVQIWGRARGGPHVEHAGHVRDAGGVEAQRLVERCRVLPRVRKQGIRGVWGELCGSAVSRQAGEAAGNGGARSVQDRARLQIDCR